MCDVKPFWELSKEEKMGLLEAWVDGKSIEYFTDSGVWATIPHPGWVPNCMYRIRPKPVTKPSVDWGAISDKFKYLAADSSGALHLFEHRPVQCTSRWFALTGREVRADILKSASSGTCCWKDSLVSRPEGV